MQGMGAMPAGDPGTVDVAGAGMTVCVTFTGSQITVQSYPAGGQPDGEGEPVTDIGDALKMVLDAYEAQERPDAGDEDFAAGYKSAAGKPEPRMTGKMPAGRMMP